MYPRSLTLGAALVALIGISNAWAATDVGVSVQVNQPGVYGRIDIGNTSRPAVVNTAPVVIMAPQPQPQQPPPSISLSALKSPPPPRTKPPEFHKKEQIDAKQ